MNKPYLLLGLAFLIAGCASEPTEEIQQADAAMTKAEQAEASQWAPEAYQKAEEKLTEAKRLVSEGEYSDSVSVLNEAKKLADEAAQAAVQAKQAAEAEKQRVEEEARQKQEAEMAARRNMHTVVKGECLWYIAGYEDVYGDPYQWPRIYHANMDKIRNPDLIYPDQVLQIPR